MTTVVWRGLDEPRMELARVEVEGTALRARGTQLGVAYELRYELEPDVLRVEVVGDRTLDVELGGLDCFDLGSSPLFNSLPVLRDGLLEGAEARDYVMRWVSVPELEVHEAPQRYEPLGGGRGPVQLGGLCRRHPIRPGRARRPLRRARRAARLMAVHGIPLERRTLHGHFSPDLPPALTIDSGDTVRYRLLDAGWNLEPPRRGPSPKFEARVPELDPVTPSAARSPSAAPSRG